jgi:hypothetical protein
MFQYSRRTARSGLSRRLRSAASAIALAIAGLALAGAASAQTVVTSTSGPTSLDGGGATAATGDSGTGLTTTGTVEVTSGTTAILTPSYGYQPNATNQGWVPLTYNAGYPYSQESGTVPASAAPQGGSVLASQIIVDQGATLVFGGQQTYQASPYYTTFNQLNAAGNVVFEGNGGYAGGNQFGLNGANTITGDMTLEAGANVRVGEYYNQVSGAAMGQYAAAGEYGASTINFGPNSNVSLQGAAGAGNDALLYLNLNAPAVIGGYLAATAESEVWLHAGTLSVNGANTDAAPFVGTLQLDGGTTFIVGDAAHPTAVFGDPNNTNGSTFTLNVNGASGNVATLKGYGTIYGTVNNNGGVVAPGGTPGAFGTLTVSQYNQSSTGVLQIEVSPTGADRLNVLGTAALGGTLQIKVDPGAYGNSVIPIITAGSITGKFASIESTGSAAAGLAITPTSYDVVTELTSSSQVFGHLVSADRANISLFTDAIYDVQTTSSKGGAPKIAYADGTEAWVEPFGQTSHVSRDGYGYSDTSEGVIGGLERKWTGFGGVAGVAFSYANGDLNTDSNKTSANSTTWNVGLYGGFDTPNARIEAIGFYNGYTASVSRNLGSSGVIDSSPRGTTLGASLQVSNPIYDGIVTPYLRFTYADIRQDGVTESGTNLLALKVNAIEKGYFDGEFGFKVHPPIKLPANIHPELTLAVSHDFTQNPGENVVAQFSNLAGAPFTFNWKGEQGTAGVAGLMLASDITSRVQVFGKIDGRFSAGAETGDLRLGASYRF